MERVHCACSVCLQAFQLSSLFSFPSPLSSLLLASPPSPSSEPRFSSKVSEKQFNSKGQGLQLQQTLEIKYKVQCPGLRKKPARRAFVRRQLSESSHFRDKFSLCWQGPAEFVIPGAASSFVPFHLELQAKYPGEGLTTRALSQRP